MVLVPTLGPVLITLIDDVGALALDVHPAHTVLFLISLLIEEAGELFVGHLVFVNPELVQIDRVHRLFVTIGAGIVAISGTHVEIASRDVNHH
jgi:hypothetical protein